MRGRGASKRKRQDGARRKQLAEDIAAVLRVVVEALDAYGHAELRGERSAPEDEPARSIVVSAPVITDDHRRRAEIALRRKRVLP